MKKKYSKPIISKKNIKLTYFSRTSSSFTPLSDLLATCQTCTGTIHVGSCQGCDINGCYDGYCIF